MVTGVADGDGDAMRRLYEATASELYTICFALVRNREATEDVLHEVYTKVWNCAAGYDPEKGSPAIWLSLIARNSAIDRICARGDRKQTYIRHAHLRRLTYSQVAEETGVPLGTAKTRIRRGLTALRARVMRDQD